MTNAFKKKFSVTKTIKYDEKFTKKHHSVLSAMHNAKDGDIHCTYAIAPH